MAELMSTKQVYEALQVSSVTFSKWRKLATAVKPKAVKGLANSTKFMWTKDQVLAVLKAANNDTTKELLKNTDILSNLK